MEHRIELERRGRDKEKVATVVLFSFLLLVHESCNFDESLCPTMCCFLWGRVKKCVVELVEVRCCFLHSSHLV